MRSSMDVHCQVNTPNHCHGGYARPLWIRATVTDRTQPLIFSHAARSVMPGTVEARTVAPSCATDRSPGADVAGVSPVRCRCGSSGPSPGADVAAVGPVPAQMWQQCAQCRRRCGDRESLHTCAGWLPSTAATRTRTCGPDAAVHRSRAGGRRARRVRAAYASWQAEEHP